MRFLKDDNICSAVTRRTGWPRRLAIATLLVAIGLSACGRDPHASTSSAAGTEPPFDTSHSTGYTVGPIQNPGRVTGNVNLTGDVPADTTVRPTSDSDVCGAEFIDTTIVRSGDGVGNAVVWLEGVTTGKQLPYIRRHDVANDGCRLTPRVQAVVAGGTLNVRSLDRVVHRNRFLRPGAHDSASVLVTENDEGQVVPLEGVLTAPGLLEIRCDQHPWTRGWVAIFTHPYFTTTKPDGSFTIDSVPPGRYRLMSWHERTGASSREVTVDPGGTAEEKIELGVIRVGGGGTK